MVKTLNECCVLHNICILFNVEQPSVIVIEPAEIATVDTYNYEETNLVNTAKRIRNKI